jgi:hypothetical protein
MSVWIDFRGLHAMLSGVAGDLSSPRLQGRNGCLAPALGFVACVEALERFRASSASTRSGRSSVECP